MADSDKISRAYSFLLSLKNNIPQKFEVEEKWAIDFNLAIEKLETSLGMDLKDFKIDHVEFKKSVSGYNPPDPFSEGKGEMFYRPGLWIERSRLMLKVDSILTYFQILNAPEGTKIGFQID